MRVTTMMPDVQYGMQQSQQALATALQQVTTSRRVNQLADDPSASASMVRLLAASGNVDRFTANVSAVTAKMQTADSALSQVVTSLNQAVSLGTGGANGTSTVSQRQVVATQVQGVLSSVIAQANTSYQGSYLFGGTATSTPPFVNAATTFDSAQGSSANSLTSTTALTVNTTTTIRDAATGKTLVYKPATGDTIDTLATVIANAVTAGTLSPGTTSSISGGKLTIAQSSGGQGLVVTTDDPALGGMGAVTGTQVPDSYVYIGNSGVNNVQVGDSLSVATNVAGDQVFTSGANVVSSLQNLIKALQSGSTTAIGAATTSVTAALNYVGQQRVPLDNSISQLNSQESYLGQESLTLTTQQTSLVGIDIAQAATNLSQAELVHSAVLAVAGKILPQTLLDYLK